ncbi:MAG: tRNA (adenosine(37)-N6)-threonylcarbamoyltransferase complex ATPase subunit type 1 TsaE [Holosporaceae bacterium]|jgi:tRNA threonylcarbamoyladenosine biosynthesis protein TsaE|nr:tRNA (adenosine(37)-N6)-threonylcarbamoyltransferase complex ATPase subunit type 1 TsaE [Holosporaceae bacterium]
MENHSPTIDSSHEPSPLLNFVCATLADIKEVAGRMVNFVAAGQRCFALYGDVGAGKTTFTKYFIQHLNPDTVDVTSPTFSLVQIYKMSNGLPDLWHADCYRLKSQNEIEELGLEDAFSSSIVIIEWPNIIEKFLPRNTVKIYITTRPDNTRNIKIAAPAMEFL